MGKLLLALLSLSLCSSLISAELFGEDFEFDDQGEDADVRPNKVCLAITYDRTVPYGDSQAHSHWDIITTESDYYMHDHDDITQCHIEVVNSNFHHDTATRVYCCNVGGDSQKAVMVLAAQKKTKTGIKYTDGFKIQKVRLLHPDGTISWLTQGSDEQPSFWLDGNYDRYPMNQYNGYYSSTDCLFGAVCELNVEESTSNCAVWV